MATFAKEHESVRDAPRSSNPLRLSTSTHVPDCCARPCDSCASCMPYLLCRASLTCLCRFRGRFRSAAHAVRACHRWHERLQSSRARCLITTTSPRWQASTINDSTAHANTCICTCTRAYACVTCDFFANGHPNQWLLSPFGAHLLYGTRRTRQGLQSTERVQYGTAAVPLRSATTRMIRPCWTTLIAVVYGSAMHVLPTQCAESGAMAVRKQWSGSTFKLA